MRAKETKERALVLVKVPSRPMDTAHWIVCSFIFPIRTHREYPGQNPCLSLISTSSSQSLLHSFHVIMVIVQSYSYLSLTELNLEFYARRVLLVVKLGFWRRLDWPVTSSSGLRSQSVCVIAAGAYELAIRDAWNECSHAPGWTIRYPGSIGSVTTMMWGETKIYMYLCGVYIHVTDEVGIRRMCDSWLDLPALLQWGWGYSHLPLTTATIRMV